MTLNYWKLDPSLQKSLSKIRISEDEKKRSNEIFKTEIDRILSQMKRDPVFKKLYRRLTYGGSTYENLKISAADEFDVNMELILPVRKGRLTVENSRVPGFVILTVDDVDNALNITDEAVRRTVKKWFDPKGRVLRTRVYQWAQGVLDKALLDYRSATKISIARKTNGPAFTLKLNNSECRELSVDLSPVFSFGGNQWPPRPVRHYSDVPALSDLFDKNWYAVPKSPGERNFEPELWRISFYYCEKHMMNGQEQLKPVLKLLKYLRDIQDWKGVSSYYIKTIFMWVQYDQDKSFWKKSLGELFLYMLEVMRVYLERESIPFFWNESYNLLDKVNRNFRLNTAQRIQRMRKRIIGSLDTNPELVLAYFTKKISPVLESAPTNAEFEKIVEEASQWRCCIL